MSKSNRTHFLREALVNRLNEVNVLLEGRSPHLFNQRARNEVEELLRIFMVRLWHRMKTSQRTEKQIEEFFSHLHQLAPMALSDDLRFLDAWNHAYECVKQLKWSEPEKQAWSLPFFANLCLPP